ncbi:proto-oncogene Mas-like [Ara ararauna]
MARIRVAAPGFLFMLELENQRHEEDARAERGGPATISRAFVLPRLEAPVLELVQQRCCREQQEVGERHGQFLEALQFLCHFFVLSSLGLLTAISTERCVSVIFPIWYRCHRPKHLSGIVSGVLWASVGSFILSFYLCFDFGLGYSTLFSSVVIVYSVILSLIMLISNVSMVMRLRCGSQRRPLGKLYVAVVLNVIFFFAFGMPFSAEVFLDLSRSWNLFPENTTLVLALLNSSINPVIYFLVGSCRQRRFQGSIKVALRRVFEVKGRSKEERPMPEGIPMQSTAHGTAEEEEA